jgi:hypothetical protein
MVGLIADKNKGNGKFQDSSGGLKRGILSEGQCALFDEGYFEGVIFHHGACCVWIMVVDIVKYEVLTH